ncbi:hypothetical protein SteCoe_7222 [Stentor coeruleus]|uniref:MPN domain-containing protein n=1 Tax=Stentor coeruleus TaxID=5963 RepID=A0A1R2CN76_9CILI|nr:hypothetical protein SteCoe_7222 [Stentor coeruleus]
MSIERILLSSDIFRGLLVHSLITEQEEVLGLLFGSTSENEVRIWGSVNLKRNCKEKDRVEVEDIQLSEAMDKAEALSQEINQHSTLVGWFHSHPNITVFPSHVDLRTQLSLQSLGPRFIGLIISCFSRDAANLEKINLIAFQTNQQSNKAMSIPVSIIPHAHLVATPQSKYDSFDYLLEVQKNLLAEEQHEFQAALAGTTDLGQVYNASVFTLSVAKILQKSLKPMYEFIQQKINIDRLRLSQIQAENAELARKIREKDWKA